MMQREIQALTRLGGVSIPVVRALRERVASGLEALPQQPVCCLVHGQLSTESLWIWFHQPSEQISRRISSTIERSQWLLTHQEHLFMAPLEPGVLGAASFGVALRAMRGMPTDPSSPRHRGDLEFRAVRLMARSPSPTTADQLRILSALCSSELASLQPELAEAFVGAGHDLLDATSVSPASLMIEGPEFSEDWWDAFIEECVPCWRDGGDAVGLAWIATVRRIWARHPGTLPSSILWSLSGFVASFAGREHIRPSASLRLTHGLLALHALHELGREEALDIWRAQVDDAWDVLSIAYSGREEGELVDILPDLLDRPRIRRGASLIFPLTRALSDWPTSESLPTRPLDLFTACLSS